MINNMIIIWRMASEAILFFQRRRWAAMIVEAQLHLEALHHQLQSGVNHLKN